MRSLSSIRAQEDRGLKHKRSVMLTTVHNRFPWLEQHNALPNYFLSGRKRSPEASDAVRRSAVVFVRQPASVGDVFNSCVERFANGSHHGGNGATEMTLGAEHFRHGLHSLGSCRNGSVPCSYFSAFYDPFHGAVSMYRHCRAATTQKADDTICATIDANNVTLRQWLLHHGSLTFQHLVSNPSLCAQRTRPGGTDSLAVSCWFRQKRELEQLNAADHDYLLDYVIENLEKWFFVIALDDAVETSAKLLETAFKIPFSNCALARSTEPTTRLDNRTYRERRKEDIVPEYTESDDDKDLDDDDNDADYLVDDYSVRTALEADYKIYHRAKEIFKMQKQFVFNTI